MTLIFCNSHAKYRTVFLVTTRKLQHCLKESYIFYKLLHSRSKSFSSAEVSCITCLFALSAQSITTVKYEVKMPPNFRPTFGASSSPSFISDCTHIVVIDHLPPPPVSFTSKQASWRSSVNLENPVYRITSHAALSLTNTYVQLYSNGH